MGRQSAPRNRTLLLLAAVSLLGACAHTYDTERSLRSPGPLAKGASFFVARPEPGSIGEHFYPASARQTAVAVANALEPFAQRVEIGGVPGDHRAALEIARESRADYAILPIIMRWEDRNTEWSGKRDRIVIRLHVLDVDSGRTIDSADIFGKSRWFTFGGDHPEELLRDPVGDYIASLFE